MRIAGLVIAALVFALPATGATPAVKATLRTSGPTVVVDQPWRYTITVRTVSGAPLRARASLKLLRGETAVGCWQDGAMKQRLPQSECDWITFRGKRTGTLVFPAQALGVQLTFQAIVRVGTKTVRLRAPVTVRATP